MPAILTAIRERQYVLVFRAFIVALFPGTFLGVWNLLSISSHKGGGTLSPAWMQVER
jgi:hypothetical protein